MAEVQVHLRPRYQCSTCARSWSKRKRAEEHVKTCIHDPVHRACPTCQHDVKEGHRMACAIDAKPDDVMCVRNCEAWTPASWLDLVATEEPKRPDDKPPAKWWLCPNDPPCLHGSIVHDIEDMEDTSPTCCVDGCNCGKADDP